MSKEYLFKISGGPAVSFEEGGRKRVEIGGGIVLANGLVDLPPSPLYPQGMTVPAVLEIDEEGGGLLWDTHIIMNGAIWSLGLGAEGDWPFSYRVMAELHCPESNNVNRPMAREETNADFSM